LFNIYIVEDEEDLRDLLKTYLVKEGYKVMAFSSGEEAVIHTDDDVHLWLLDIMLPGDLNGFDILKRIRKKHDTPVIFISARSQDIDCILGLESGSDDYITKPFSPREVMLRVSNVLKRVYKGSSSDMISYDRYSIDLLKRSACEKEGMIDLTSKEMDLLILLVQNKNQAFTREHILGNIWGNDYFGSDRVVDDLVKRLRKKMSALKIETIYGYGYRLK
jgi:two-component system, OmpR family, response regulator CssR